MIFKQMTLRSRCVLLTPTQRGTPSTLRTTDEEIEENGIIGLRHYKTFHVTHLLTAEHNISTSLRFQGLTRNKHYKTTRRKWNKTTQTQQQQKNSFHIVSLIHSQAA